MSSRAAACRKLWYLVLCGRRLLTGLGLQFALHFLFQSGLPPSHSSESVFVRDTDDLNLTKSSSRISDLLLLDVSAAFSLEDHSLLHQHSLSLGFWELPTLPECCSYFPGFYFWMLCTDPSSSLNLSILHHSRILLSHLLLFTHTSFLVPGLPIPLAPELS